MDTELGFYEKWHGVIFLRNPPRTQMKETDASLDISNNVKIFNAAEYAVIRYSSQDSESDFSERTLN